MKAARMGAKLIINMDNRGPTHTNAWNRKASPRTKPTIPDNPNQIHWSKFALVGQGVPKNIQ